MHCSSETLPSLSAVQEISRPMWKFRVVTKLSSKMNSDQQLDDVDVDNNDKSKPNGISRSLSRIWDINLSYP